MFVVKHTMNFDPTLLLEKDNVGFRDHRTLCMCPLYRRLFWNITVSKINRTYVQINGVGATLISCNFRTRNDALKWILKNVQLTLK
jgi:hypothetical protein